MLADIRSILFIELLGGLGDLLMALPAIHALAREYPEATIHILTFPPGGELVESDPAISRVLYAARDRAPDAVRDILSSRHFDLIVSDSCYGALAGPSRFSFPQGRILNVWESGRRDELIENLFLRNLTSAGIIGGTNHQNGPSLIVGETEKDWAAMWRERNLPQAGKIVLVNPHAGMAIKRWDAESFITLGRALAEEGVGLVLVSGDDPSLARHIARQIGPAASLLPTTTLRQFAAVAASADLCLSVDTGPGRIAAAVGTPTIMLFGPTWSRRYGLPAPNVNLQSPFVCPHLNPMNFTEQPCWYSAICSFPEKRSCVGDIAPDSVYSVAKRMLRLLPVPMRKGKG